MTPRAISTLIAIWLGFALVGGILDSTVLAGFGAGSGDGCEEHTGDADVLCGLQQIRAESATEESTIPVIGGAITFFKRTSYFISTGFAVIKAFINALFLNFSFFSGDWAIVGWIVRLIIGIPLGLMLAFRRAGMA